MAVQGTWFGGQGIFADRGYTEKLTQLFGGRGSVQPTTFYNPAAAQASNLRGMTGAPVYGTPTRQPVQTNPQPINIAPGNTGGGNGGDGGGGGGNNIPVQNIPSEPQIDYDAMIRPALEGLSAQEGAQQSGYEANLAQIDQQRAARAGQLGQTRQEALTGAEASRQRLSGQTESAVDEARRQFSEIQQGLQSRYGGTTGTGAFVESLAGREALKNIGQNRRALTEAIRDVDNQLESVKMSVGLAEDDLAYQADVQKQQAKAQLDNAMSAIRMAKGELLSKKVELAQNAMQFYRQQVADVDARNTGIKQQLYMQQRQHEMALAEKRAGYSNAIKRFSLVNIDGIPYRFDPYSGATEKGDTTQTNPFGAGQLSGVAGGYTKEDEIDAGNWGGRPAS